MSIGGISGSGYLNASFNQPASGASLGATKDDLTKLAASLQGTAKSQGVGSLLTNFDKIDLNRDGSLGASELAIYKKALLPEPQKGILGDGLTLEKLLALDVKVQGAGEDDTELKQLITSFAEADSNKDGKVDAAEIDSLAKSSAAKARSQGLDSGGLALISPRDLQNLLKHYQASLTATKTATAAVASTNALATNVVA